MLEFMDQILISYFALIQIVERNYGNIGIMIIEYFHPLSQMGNYSVIQITNYTVSILKMG